MPRPEGRRPTSAGNLPVWNGFVNIKRAYQKIRHPLSDIDVYFAVCGAAGAGATGATGVAGGAAGGPEGVAGAAFCASGREAPSMSELPLREAV
jgi:hypothetical protein